MKELVLMRHGNALSVTESDAKTDDGRRLSRAGIEQIEISALRLKTSGFSPALILSSPLIRAVETADITARCFPDAKRLKTEILAFSSALQHILTSIEKSADTAPSVIAVGHQPTMGALCGLLLKSPPLSFGTGNFARLKISGRLIGGAAELVEFFSPEAVL